MSGVRPRMTHLFEQLGLDASEEAIQQFIETHQLSAETNIADADFWTDAQRQFIVEKIKSDGSWAIVVDQLIRSICSCCGSVTCWCSWDMNRETIGCSRGQSFGSLSPRNRL